MKRLNKNFWLIFVLILIVASWLLLKQKSSPLTIIDTDTDNIEQMVDDKSDVKIVLKDQTFVLEIADTPAKQRQGLSGRASLASDHGMLFVYPEEKILTFWMKDMKFDVDVLWIAGDKIVAWEKNMAAPLPDVTDSQLLQYTSAFPADKALELSSGSIDRLGLKLGDSIDLAGVIPLE